MEIKETISMMNSTDYKERFKAEYYQLKIRFNKLQDMLDKWDNNQLEFIPTCPRDVYDTQIKAMAEYLVTLDLRANIENIKLEGIA